MRQRICKALQMRGMGHTQGVSQVEGVGRDFDQLWARGGNWVFVVSDAGVWSSA